MITFIKLYAIALAIFLIIDAFWLVGVAPKFYRTHIGYIMADKPNLTAALIFYLIFIFGFIVFVITPALSNPSILNVMLKGALFGLVTYATYDLTNQATVRDWPMIVTIVDLIWGTVITSTVSVLTLLVVSYLGIH